jgi:hypothetical protein
LVIGKDDRRRGRRQRQTGGAETPHLLDAFRIHALQGMAGALPISACIAAICGQSGAAAWLAASASFGGISCSVIPPTKAMTVSSTTSR